MGMYCPAGEVVTIGRKLRTMGPFETLVAELLPGEILFGVADCGALRPQNPLSALYMQSERDHLDSMQGESRGYYDLKGYYAVPKEVAEKMIDCSLPPMEIVFPVLTLRDFEEIKEDQRFERICEVTVHSTNKVSMGEYYHCLKQLRIKAQAAGGHLIVIEVHEEDWNASFMNFKGGVYKRK